MMHPRETRTLPCRLTDEELRERGQALAQTVQNIATEQTRQTDLKAQMKATLAGLQARESLLANVVARREEFRDVLVALVPDHAAGTLTEVRLDTGEAFYTRPLTEDERQLSLLAE